MSTLVDLAEQNFIAVGGSADFLTGWNVSDAGDLNGDGFDDVVIGTLFAGEAYVVFGQAAGFSITNLGNLQPADGFVIRNTPGDISVSGAGDINGDGFDDLIIGGNFGGGYWYYYYGNDPGAYVIFGRSGGFGTIDLSNLSSSQGFRISGQFTNSPGFEVSSAGDVNGDGFDDIIIGSTFDASSGEGAAYVILGKASGFGSIDLTTLPSASGYKLIGAKQGDLTGFSVSGAGDINGDGYDDIIIGAPNADIGGTDAGVAYVIFGKATGLGGIRLGDLSPTTGFYIHGDDAGDNAGWSVSAAGDVNGDGYDDLIIGAPFGNSAGFESGEAYVIFGKASGFTSIDLGNITPGAGFAIRADNAGDLAGWSVSAAGDVNGDGYADIIVGAPRNQTTRDGAAPAIAAGESYVIFGKAGGFTTVDLSNLAPSAGFIIQGEMANDSSGWSVSGAGDVDNDGFDDLLVSAPFNDRGGFNAGATYIISGKLSFAADARSDFNGDGRSDVLWVNDNGAVTNWLGQANGGFISNIGNAAHNVGADWNVAGTGDFNGDGRDDVLWRSDSGAVTNWLGQANGGFASNFANSYGVVDNSWDIAGTGDFNGDGRDDVLWRNDNGTVINWLAQANGGFISNIANANVPVSNSWHIAGTGDFNGDGRDDVLWRSDSGAVTNWLGQANGGFVGNFANSSNQVGANWHVAGTGDFNGDGRDDVLWRSDSGQFTNWLGQANGAFVGNFANASNNVGPEWHVASIGDYNGDGRDDILWRSDSGAVTNWLGQENGGFASNFGNAYGEVDNSWHIFPVSEVLV